MGANAALTGGFADPVFQSQAVFRAVLDAMAGPGAVLAIASNATPPAPLNPTAGAILLALADADTPVFLDHELAAVPSIAEWIRFHADASVVTAPRQASFAVIANPENLEPLTAFAQGSAEYPDRSATLIVQVAGLSQGGGFTLRGPGIRDMRSLAVTGLPQSFAALWNENRAAFPLGVDLILAAPAAIAALPRTTEIIIHPAAGRGL